MSDEFAYKRLASAPISSKGCFVLDAFNPPAVSADSPALQAMTDLSRVPPATITADAPLAEANQSMLLRGVRLLLVVGDQHRIVGVVTSVDLLGEKPVRIAGQRHCPPAELKVADVMTPVEAMETLAIEDVRKALVGNIVSTLKADGRAHALVVGEMPDNQQHLMGIFSASQIARQLGIVLHTHEMAKTFAEIEAVISSH